MMFVFNQYRDVYGNLVYVLSKKSIGKLMNILKEVLGRAPGKIREVMGGVKETLIGILNAISGITGKDMRERISYYSCVGGFVLSRGYRTGKPYSLSDVDILNEMTGRISEGVNSLSINDRKTVLQSYLNLVKFLIYFRLEESKSGNSSYDDSKYDDADFITAVGDFLNSFATCYKCLYSTQQGEKELESLLSGLSQEIEKYPVGSNMKREILYLISNVEKRIYSSSFL